MWSARRLALLVLDAITFTLAGYGIMVSSFLAADTVLTLPAWGARVLICAVAQCAAACLTLRAAGRRGRILKLFLAADLVLMVAAFVFGPAYVMNLTPEKGRSYLWYPLEWDKFYLNLILLARSCPPYFPFLAALVLALLYARFKLRSRWGVSLFLLLVLISLWILSGTSVNFESLNLYFFALPMIPMVITSLLGWDRFLARSLVAGGILTSIGIFYMGFIPPWPQLEDVARRREPLTRPVSTILSGEGEPELLYPRSGEPSLLTLPYLRSMLYDRVTRKLYVSYGPTSGLGCIDAETGRLETLARIKGMMRFLWTQPGEPFLYGLDWLVADMYVFQKEPLQLLKRVDLYGENSSPSPFDLAVSTRRDRLYTVSYERARVEERELGTLRRTRVLPFREMGLTEFNAGGQRCALDDERGVLYVLLGEVNRKQEYRILEIDLDSLSVRRCVTLESAGLELAYLPQKHAILTGDFYGRDIFVVDTESFTLRRVLRGPLSLRNAAFDQRRNLLYATGYADGHLEFLDFGTGRKVATLEVGPKPSSMIYVPEIDMIFVGSAFGIFKVHPSRILGEAPGGQNRD